MHTWQESTNPIVVGDNNYKFHHPVGPEAPWIEGCDCGDIFTKESAVKIGQALLDWANKKEK